MKWLLELFSKIFSKKKSETSSDIENTSTNIDSSIIDIIETTLEADQDNLEDDGDDVKENVNSTSAPEYKQYPNLCVCLDPGHGSDTPGKRSPYASDKKNLPALYFREYEFSRDIVNRIKTELEKHGVEVFITVTEEKDILLTTRYKRANSHKAKNTNKKYVFISVHSNAAGNGHQWMNARGWSVWTTKGQNYSDKLATCLYNIAEEILPPLKQKMRKDISDGDPDYESNFTVIYGANMPAILTENMFQDNVEDVQFLLSEEGRQAITDIHVKGILKFADEILKM